jgi:predicted hydrocarbon binding protein
MPSIRGLVLMSRLEYIEKKYGAEEYRDFLKKISTEEINFLRQPLDGAFIYPDSILLTIDRIMLEEYLNNDLQAFKELGKWGAENFMYRYFSLYVDLHQPVEFLEQYARLREYLIGSGVMNVHVIDQNHLELSIDYGQRIPKSVCLSEQGFIEGGMELCSGTNISFKESLCASESDNFVCRFKVHLA